jgi:hypothetical protein
MNAAAGDSKTVEVLPHITADTTRAYWGVLDQLRGPEAPRLQGRMEIPPPRGVRRTPWPGSVAFREHLTGWRGGDQTGQVPASPRPGKAGQASYEYQRLGPAVCYAVGRNAAENGPGLMIDRKGWRRRGGCGPGRMAAELAKIPAADVAGPWLAGFAQRHRRS